MKKIYYSLLFAASVASLAACSSDDPKPGPDPNPTPTDGVEVTIATSDINTEAAKLQFTANDKMNIFPKTYNQASAPNIVDGVVASYDGSKWSMNPKVYISDSQPNAFVYAIAPYDASYTDLLKIPVDVNKQVDLLYSGSYVPASMTSPAIKLKMKHALALMSFNIVPVDFAGAGKLTSLAVNGELVYSTGTLNGTKGDITNGEVGEIKVAVDRTVEKGGWKTNIPGLWAIPFTTKGQPATLTAVIDGKTYTAIIPEVEMRSGFQFIFRLALTNSGLEFDPSQTETISLNVQEDQPQEFQKYGKIVVGTSGSWIFSPTLNGDAVFGSIVTPSLQMSYSANTKLEGLSAGQQVTIESWNSNGAEFPTLDGIDTIDFSRYE